MLIASAGHDGFWVKLSKFGLGSWQEAYFELICG
jgi:hypothetical protein